MNLKKSWSSIPEKIKIQYGRLGLILPLQVLNGHSGTHSTDYLYPDTKAVLEQLQRDYRLGVIANQKENLAERLENWGIADYFQLVLSSSAVGYSKPDVRIFSSALELAGILPQEAIYIGDRIDNDMIPAKKLGMTTIWLQAGLGKYNQEDSLYKVDWVVSSLTEVVDVLIK
ncbi:HAD family hydrolase [Streptococcus gallolyticus]|nr:HAD family hydrolase [Streptococcus gallolyticus]MBY5041111.1 HAD family hydrolase [Streptococcus gallolyticus]